MFRFCESPYELLVLNVDLVVFLLVASIYWPVVLELSLIFG